MNAGAPVDRWTDKRLQTTAPRFRGPTVSPAIINMQPAILGRGAIPQMLFGQRAQISSCWQARTREL